MAISTPVVVGTADATGTDTIVIPFSSAVPQSTPALSSAVILFLQPVLDLMGDGTYTDDAAFGVGYCDVLNGWDADGVGFNQIIGTDNLIFNPLLTSNSLTVTFLDVQDYIHATAVAVTGLKADAGLAAVTKASNGTPDPADMCGSGDIALNPLAQIGFYMLGQSQTPGTSALTWNDPDIILLDSWYDQGPDGSSGIVGYRTIPDASLMYDLAGCSDVAGFLGWAALFMTGGAGPPLCTPPTGGYPILHGHIRLSE